MNPEGVHGQPLGLPDYDNGNCKHWGVAENRQDSSCPLSAIRAKDDTAQSTKVIQVLARDLNDLKGNCYNI